MRLTLAAATAFMALAMATSHPAPAVAQSSAFGARVLVNSKAITHYEYDQRLRFMRLLNAPGDLVKEAEKSLIEDRLRLDAADRQKIRVTPKQITDGMTEFAGRFEMPLEEFVAILEANGVAAETYRDFVHSGIAWREVVRQKFGPSALASIYEVQIDHALSTLSQKTTSQLLLSEIVIETDKRNLARELSQTLKGEAAFAAAARQHSIAKNAAEGGRTDWRDATSLSNETLAQLQQMSVGQVSAPIRNKDGHFVIYLMRQVRSGEKLTPQNTALSYATVALGANGSAEAAALYARVAASADTCKDLHSFGKVTETTQVQAKIAAPVAGALAALDENEITSYVSGGQQVALMLCTRRASTSVEANRDVIRGRLAEANVGAESDLYLQQLRANAHIRKP